MSLLEIDSVLFEEITYSFDNDDIEEQDVNLETNLHSIKIFNKCFIVFCFKNEWNSKMKKNEGKSEK